MRISITYLKNVCTHSITKKTQIRFSLYGTQGAKLRPHQTEDKITTHRHKAKINYVSLRQTFYLIVECGK